MVLMLSICFSVCACDISGFVDAGEGGSSSQGGGGTENEGMGNTDVGGTGAVSSFDLAQVPAYSDKPYYIINNNKPFFEESELVTASYEMYKNLDSLGRCTLAVACIGRDLMPTEDRGSISSVKPSGWVQAQYDTISGKDLYNRCHLIGWQLTAEDANKENLITGTRYMNVEGMLPFENMVADYLKEYNDNHVMYRVTPIFDGNDLVAKGVLIEAYSVEDNGEGICFNVFVYNVQPGIVINYATGESYLEGEENNSGSSETPDNGSDNNSSENTGSTEDSSGATYIINVSTKKYHKISHYEGKLTSNMQYTTLTAEELEAQGYSACGTCKPNK